MVKVVWTKTDKEIQRRWYQKLKANPVRYKGFLKKKRIRMAQRRKKIRWIILTHYGGNPPKCACCGEAQIQFLSIDHIHGGGNEHRKELGRGKAYRVTSHMLYKDIVKKCFPKEFQVLCYNCNFAKGHYGICPHKVGVGQ